MLNNKKQFLIIFFVILFFIIILAVLFIFKKDKAETVLKSVPAQEQTKESKPSALQNGACQTLQNPDYCWLELARDKQDDLLICDNIQDNILRRVCQDETAFSIAIQKKNFASCLELK